MAEEVALATSKGSVRQQLTNLVKESFRAGLGVWGDREPVVNACNPKFGDYQINNAMQLWSDMKNKQTEFKNPISIAQCIAKNLPTNSVFESSTIAGAGYVNLVLSTNFISERIEQMLTYGIDSWAPILPVKRAVVDYSSPNIAKEMHVGHLRSTIIGDSIANMLEYCKVVVLRRNHVGDWGTQFGMLIEYLFERFPNWEEIGDQAIADLQTFYKAAKVKFDSDPEFKEKSQKAVVKLQSGEATYVAAWQVICSISRKEFAQVYKRLKIGRLEEKGESFYKPYISDTLKILEEKGLVEESEGAKVIFVEGQSIPLIVVKSDGGYGYATTDMATIWYRLFVECGEWVLYVTDVGQSQHFDMFFKAAKRAGWLPASGGLPKAQHVPFGLVLGTDKKRFRTRAGEVVRLVELLDEAKSRSKEGLISRGRDEEWSEDELEAASEALGYGAIKYADLKNNRETNYVFDYDQMLDQRGNTAVYLLYAHARICSILRKSGKDIQQLKKSGSIVLGDECERQLGLHLIQFSENVEDSISKFLPNVMCEYVYNLSELFSKFYTNCKVIGVEEETSRLLLCEATAIVMRECFKLLGITPLYRL